MLDILSIIPGKKRKTASGWVVFNGICCHHRGHNPDKRARAGLKIDSVSEWIYSCFNCNFKCAFSLGHTFSPNLRQLLSWSGLDKTEIDRLSFENFRLQSIEHMLNKRPVITVPDFEERSLPENARLITHTDTEHVNYLASRGLTVNDYPFYLVDNESRTRIIIPYFYKGKIVGNTSRYCDGRKPKYISEQQSGYVFNIDAQRSNWQVCIAVEGQFDAISIDGCAYMGSSISETQANILKKLYRKIIVVPDHDKSGLEVCNQALDYGFHVSIPEWESDIKDVNDAVLRYGRLATTLSILQNATSSRIVTEMRKKKL